MKYTFQHFMDISTSASSLTLLQINAGGQYTLDRIKHLFPAFKYIKYGRISVKLLPASTLPVDPLGLGYESDDPQTVDPRDQMNPGLVRITNGEDIFTNFASYSENVQQTIYNNTMLDPRWSKFMLQSGFKRSAVPLYWNVGQLAQDTYPGSVINVPGAGSADSPGVTYTSSISFYDAAANAADSGNYDVIGAIDRSFSDPRGLFQTGHRGRMGWMPTDAFYRKKHANADGSLNQSLRPQIQPLPEIQCITVLLPKAYKTRYYYRLFITETVYLSGVKNVGIEGTDGGEYHAIDNFMRSYPISPSSPIAPNTTVSSASPLNTGGGDE